MSKEKECDGKDYVVPAKVLEDGSCLGVRHRPDHSAEVCRLVPINSDDSVPMGTELTVKNEQGLFEVVSKKAGPVKVTNDKYRKGWGVVFAQKGGKA